MMELPKIETLSAVLNLPIVEVFELNGEVCVRISGEPSSVHRCHNRYELAHKCKEWAYKNKFSISSAKTLHDGWIAEITGQVMFKASTEPEAVFKACNWIFDNTKPTEATFKPKGVVRKLF